MGPIHKFREVFHPAFSVRVLEEHPTNILSIEVHLMWQLQHSLHPDVATNDKRSQMTINSFLYAQTIWFNSIVKLNQGDVLGSGLHHCNGLWMTTGINVEDPSLVLPTDIKQSMSLIAKPN